MDGILTIDRWSASVAIFIMSMCKKHAFRGWRETSRSLPEVPFARWTEDVGSGCGAIGSTLVTFQSLCRRKSVRYTECSWRAPDSGLESFESQSPVCPRCLGVPEPSIVDCRKSLPKVRGSSSTGCAPGVRHRVLSGAWQRSGQSGGSHKLTNIHLPCRYVQVSARPWSTRELHRTRCSSL